MVSKCANPECSTPFRSLRTGKLIRVESGPETPVSETEQAFGWSKSARRAEFFWLCENCSSKGLTFHKDGSIAPALCAGAARASL